MQKALLSIALLLSFLPFTVFGQRSSDYQKAVGIIVVTPYKTTLIANGTDEANIKISLIDKQGNELTNAGNLIHFTLSGDAKILSITNGLDKPHDPRAALQENLHNGELTLVLQAGNDRSILKLTASGDSLFSASTEIHTIHPGTPHPVTTGTAIAGNTKITDKIIGADISFLPEREARGMKFYDTTGKQTDALTLLKDYGFNYIRLRVFVDPADSGGYSRGKGFCDLAHTEQMAKRIKAAGMKFLLDFHYSDTWADPQRQDIPARWKGPGL